MRWGAQPAFNGAVSAVAATLSARDEDIYFHFPSVVPATTHVRRTSGAQPKRRTSTPAVATAGNNAAVACPDPERAPSLLHPIAVEPSERLELAEEAAATTSENFLMCSGRSVHTPREGLAQSPRSDTTVTPRAIAAQRSIGTSDSPRGMIGINNSSAERQQRMLQRSDSELERIISELRERIAQQQQDEAKRASTPELQAPTMARKHLKNPVEKVQLLSTNPSGVSTAGHPLRRQASFNSRNTLALSASQQSLEAARSVARAGEVSEFSSDGFRIVSYADTSALSRKGPHFTSSTALKPAEAPPEASKTEPRSTYTLLAAAPGPAVPTHSASPTSEPQSAAATPSPPVAPARAAAPLRRSRSSKVVDQRVERGPGPQVSLQGLSLLEFNAASEDEEDEMLSRSPVGPWATDEVYSPGAPSKDEMLSRSPVGPWATDEVYSPGAPSSASNSATASLSGSASSPALFAITTMAPPESIGDLSPRSRLLWLSECSFEEPPIASQRADQRSTKTMLRLWEMLRPGATRSSEAGASKPVSRTAGKPGAEDDAKSREGLVLRHE
ncbi:hypothetical protein P43SY_007316 [Pythium insidiosum]|uniref:Uncharacterized protein n=1 Tax=Pythium insidiosum TaxID=114742 RepID=A0AAD5LZU3_PYTIN|nr:hypothetical protein P43SY_007316 [Pythium insidiosum]